MLLPKMPLFIDPPLLKFTTTNLPLSDGALGKHFPQPLAAPLTLKASAFTPLNAQT